ncbi:dynamin family protein [Desulfococcaceae bacterium HSG9]|nr:dynamin family protein [Desulfococcaceae bacterium HSG9]
MKVNMWEQTLNEMSELLNLHKDDTEPATRGILGILKSSIELAHLADEPKEFLKNVKPYLDILIPDSDEGLLESIFNEYPEEIKDRQWITEYPDDMNNDFPKPLFLWGLAKIIPISSNQVRSWAYIDKSVEYLKIDHEFLSNFSGWLTGAADQDTTESVKRFLDIYSKTNSTCFKLVEILKSNAGEENLNTDFISIREKVQNKLDKIKTCLAFFNLEDSVSLKKIEDYLANDSFRLAVLGEFKRGKSTLINAIVDTPGLMPADFLPCTSALTEIKYGDKTLYKVNNDGPFGSFIPSDIGEFHKKAAAAAELKTIQAEAERQAEQVPRWRVDIPSPFLKGSFISIIDSPGIGEDYARDRISRAEAERADAAIIVFNADQPVSLQELELIEKMRSKASHLIIAINRVDNVPESQWKRLKGHVVDRISSVTDGIPKENIVLISALKAEEAIKQNFTSDDPWLIRINNMKDIIQNHLIKKAGPIKQGMLKDKVINFVKSCQGQIYGHCRLKENGFKRLQELEKNKENAKKSYDRAQLAIEIGVKKLENSEDEKNQFIKFFESKLPEILESTKEKEANWTSQYSLFKPRKHVEEVAKKAQKDLLIEVENMIKEEGGPKIAKLVEQKYEETENKLSALKEYLKQTTGVDGATQLKEIKKQVFIDTFGDIDFGMTGGIVGRLALAGALSAVFGYAIADIVLYYLLSIIAGFLNPLLIVAALILALLAATSIGKAWAKAKVREKVFSKIKEGLESDKNKKKINEALGKAIADIFNSMAKAFKDNANGVLWEANFQQNKREEEMENFIASQGGTPESIEKELSEIKMNADKAEQALSELKICVERDTNTDVV